MNKNKFSTDLLQEVNSLNLSAVKSFFISSSNFDKTKQFLIEHNYKFKPYRFAKCFLVDCQIGDLENFSVLKEVELIHSNSYVLTCGTEHDVINLNKITEGKYFGKGVTICFIDTGIAPHFDFIFPYSRIVKFVDLINNKMFPYDDNGHGTFVCGVACGGGIISKNNVGIAPLSNIVSIKALKSDGSSNSNTILDAMQWIYENHKVFNISVVCMSFGADSSDNSPLAKGAEALWNLGITVVAAAGNSGPKTHTIKSPGISPKIITVGAFDSFKFKTANFSSRGPTCFGYKPDFIAPAVDLISCNNKIIPYTKMSGTSVSSPIVAGVCAVIKSKHRNATNNEIKKFLIANCKPISNNRNEEGFGLLQF